VVGPNGVGVTRRPEFFDLRNPAHFEILAEEFLPRSGGVITGAMQMQSAIIKSADSGARWEGDVRGLRGYDTTGALVFNLDTTTGSLTLTGAVSAGGTITGSTIQTAASGKRVVIAGSPGDRIDFYSGSADETSNGYILVAVSGAAGATAGVATWVTPAINSKNRASISMTSESKDGSTSETVIALSADTVLGVATTGSADTSLQWQGDIALFDSVSDPPTGAASYVRVFNSGGTGLRATSSAETAPLWPNRTFQATPTADLLTSTTVTTMTNGTTATITTRVPNALVVVSAFFDVDVTTTGTGFVNGYVNTTWAGSNDLMAFFEDRVHRTGKGSTRTYVVATPGAYTVALRANKNAAGGAATIKKDNTHLDILVIG
jgi:hypothetical protein